MGSNHLIAPLEINYKIIEECCTKNIQHSELKNL